MRNLFVTLMALVFASTAWAEGMTPSADYHFSLFGDDVNKDVHDSAEAWVGLSGEHKGVSLNLYGKLSDTPETDLEEANLSKSFGALSVLVGKTKTNVDGFDGRQQSSALLRSSHLAPVAPFANVVAVSYGVLTVQALEDTTLSTPEDRAHTASAQVETSLAKGMTLLVQTMPYNEGKSMFSTAGLKLETGALIATVDATLNNQDGTQTTGAAAHAELNCGCGAVPFGGYTYLESDESVVWLGGVRLADEAFSPYVALRGTDAPGSDATTSGLLGVRGSL